MTQEKKKRSKFNVGSDLEQRTFDGILFDSKMEMHFYRDVVLPQVRSGLITHYELQKAYVLQPKFHNGEKTVQPITYVADFYLEYSDGRPDEVIDTKGCADSVAKMKRKMFWYTYPNVKYRWLTYVKKYGGWLDYDEVARLRRQAKKEKGLKDQERNDEHGKEEDEVCC